MRKFLILSLWWCLCSTSIAFGKVDVPEVYQDALDKLWPTEILGTAKGKLDERIYNSPDYRFFAGREMVNNFWLDFDPPTNYRYDTHTEAVMADLVKNDVVESLRYGLKRQARNLKLYTLIRQWGKGLSTMQIDKPSSTDEFIFKTPSLNRRLDPYKESKNDIDFECSNIVGDAAVVFNQRLRCSEAANEISLIEAQIYDVRFEPGIDVGVHTTNNRGITPIAKPYLEVKYRGYTTELSYTYPYNLVSNGDQPATFLPDIRDKIFSARDERERVELGIDKTITKHFVLSGNYRYERILGDSSIGIGPKLFLSPWLASASGDVNMSTMNPILALDIGRVVGTYVLGVRGTAIQNQPGSKNEWDYEALFTVSKIWSPYQPSFFDDIKNVYHKLF